MIYLLNLPLDQVFQVDLAVQEDQQDPEKYNIH